MDMPSEALVPMSCGPLQGISHPTASFHVCTPGVGCALTMLAKFTNAPGSALQDIHGRTFDISTGGMLHLTRAVVSHLVSQHQQKHQPLSAAVHVYISTT